MTTICTDGVVVAADSQRTHSFIVQGNVEKLQSLKDGSVIGLAGDCECYKKAINYLNNGGDKPEFKDAEFSALILNRKGKVFYVDERLEVIEERSPFSVGSGAKFAMGALLVGAPLRQAVKAAIKLDAYSGGKVRTMTPMKRGK